MYHQPFYASTQGLSNPYIPTQSYFYRTGPIPTSSNQNLNFTHDFDRFSMPQTASAFASMPTGAYPFYDSTNRNYDQQRWKPAFTRIPHPHTSAFHFQDKSTFYYMSDPIRTSDDRITIQLTKVHIGPNGDQQRVFVEQEFSNEHELKKFVKNLRENFEKTFNHRATGTKSSSENTDDSADRNSLRKSGIFVVEEPDEEPKIYPQKPNESLRPSPVAQATKPIEFEENQRSKRRKAKKKSRRTGGNAENSNPNESNHRKSTNLSHTPSYSRYYEPQSSSRGFVKDNEFRVPSQPNIWRHQVHPHVLNNLSRAFVPSTNDNQSTRFPGPKSVRPRNPTPPRVRRSRPTTMADHFHFTHVQEEHQPRVQRTRSECRPKFGGDAMKNVPFPSKQSVRFQPKSFAPFLSRPVRAQTPIFFHSRPVSNFRPIHSRLFPSNRF